MIYFDKEINMKVLHINSYYVGGNFYKNLYDKQKELGLDIDVYVPVSNAIDISKLQLGDYTTISRNHNKYDRFCFHIKHNKIYKDIVNKYTISKYSIIHAHSLFSNGYIAYKIYKKYRIPYIVAVRNTDVNVFFKKMIFLRRLGINILRNAEKVIFISKPYREYTINNFVPDKYKEEISNKSIVLPNGIDDFWINNKIEKKTPPNGKKIRIIYVGVVNSNKNVETTINACELLIKLGYEVSYTIVGRITRKKYWNIINQYTFIKYVPHCKKEDLINYYRNADIFVMPSKHETFGLVYAEAMSQGLPVIYTKGQGFDGQFEEGEIGFSVAYDSPKEIADRIVDILNNYVNISYRCLLNIDRFKWDEIAKKYYEIYKAILP